MTHLFPVEDLASLSTSELAPRVTDIHLAVPRRGNVLTTVAEKHGDPLRQAALFLARFLSEPGASRQQASLLARPHAGKGVGGFERSPAEAAAWSLVAAWAVGVALRCLSPRASLLQAEEWFGTAGTEASVCQFLPEGAQHKARAVMGRSNPEPLAQLLPYVLDPHGPGSRLSVMRRPETREARARKRAEGAFYTPADVADYMAGFVLPDTPGPRRPVFLDLACGTGVFLRAALKRLAAVLPGTNKADLALASLHGVDIDPTALNGAAFVLLLDSLAGTSASAPPVELWRLLRANLLWADALSLDPGRHNKTCGQGGTGSRTSLGARLPALAKGADIVLGNPPYADLGTRSDFPILARVFETVAAAPAPKADLYPVFVEQMIRLAAPAAAGSLVLPLSLACNTGPQFVAMRRLITRTPGQWRFAFFDRQPHALFGEDVKTRNAIVAWNRESDAPDTTILTGPLRKWRAQGRAAMFERISFTPLPVPVISGIPKVSGRVQAEALASLSRRPMRLSGMVLAFGRRAPNISGSSRPTVFVGATAYNFLNVFREMVAVTPDGLQPTSHHPHALDCASERDAHAVLALLASGMAFWWWHAHDDGFHVSRSTLEELPVGIDVLSAPAGDALAEIGAQIWASARGAPVVSNNGGKASFAFPPSRYAAERAATDRVLRRALELPPAFDAELEHFLHDVTSAGGGARAHQHGETDE